MEIILTQYQWLKLTPKQRSLMRLEFTIPKSGGVVMQDNRMMSDGSNENDLGVVNTESMHAFLGKESEAITRFDELFTLTLQKIDLLIEEEENKTKMVAQAFSEDQREKEVRTLVSSVKHTIKNLPLDAQVEIAVSLQHLLEDKKVEEPHGTEESTTKKGKKGSNK